MSIYIPGMEMPESCHDCRFCGWSNFWQAYDCYMTKNHALLSFNGEKTNSDSKTRNGRADNCPLVPVPPHGRLIDKNVMCNECRRVAEEYDGIYPDCTYCPAHLAPTIIPADKEGEG